MDSKETVDQILSELGDQRDLDVEFMKRASELYYSNEDKIVPPQHFARHNRSVESDLDDDNLVQHMKEVAEYFFNNEEDGLAFLPAHFLDDEESERLIEADADVSAPSMERLRKAEAIVMSGIKPDVRDITVAEEVVIHTVCFKAGLHDCQSPKVPLVLVHGFGGANPAFHKNYGPLAKDRWTYGIDLPGFALSSRMKFSNDVTSCEDEIVGLIESWRKEMKLKKIILLGHSFGGYISAAYAIKHSSHVDHLFLLDPWGILSKDEDQNRKRKGMLEEILKKFCERFKANPFKALQRLGPFFDVVKVLSQWATQHCN